MDTAPSTRHARIARVRRKVVAGVAALFLASLGGVIFLGHQPGAKVAAASASSATAAAVAESRDDDYYDDDGAAYAPSQAQTSSPAPLTTRTS